MKKGSFVNKKVIEINSSDDEISNTKRDSPKKASEINNNDTTVCTKS